MSFFLGLLGGGWGLLKRGFALLGKLNVWQLLCIALFAAAGIFYVQRNNARDDASTAHFNLNECREMRKQDRAAYEQAQRDAKAKNNADVARIEAEQERISSDVQSNLNARLERLRSELRSRSGPAQGVAGRPQASPDGKAPGGADGSANVCVAPEVILRAAENEERHDELITWVERQLGVVR